MPIVPSRARDIQKLVEQLGAESAARRQSAVARLRLLGERAIPPLLAPLRSASPAVRREALGVLEGARSARARAEVLRLVGDPDAEVAQRALEVAGGYADAAVAEAIGQRLGALPPALHGAAVGALARIHAAGVVEAIDGLLDALLDDQEDDVVRLSALDEVSRLPAKELAPVLGRLRRSGSPTLAARAAELERLLPGSPGASPRARPDPLEILPEAPGRAAGALPRIHRDLERTDDPARLRQLAESAAEIGGAASIPVLRGVLDRLSDRPRGEGSAAEVAATKAAVHAALATLGSRIALDDLRAMLAARPPLAAASLLETAERIGDASLVPALAALASSEPRLLPRCARAFAAIAARERLQPGSRALKGVRREHRPALAALRARAARRR